MTISCPIAACEASVTGNLKLPSRKSQPAVAGQIPLGAGVDGQLELKLSKRVAAQLKKKRRRASLNLTATVVDPLGFADTETQSYRFKR